MKYRTQILGLTGLLALLAFWQIGSLILAQSMPLSNMLTPAAALGSLAHLLPEAALWAHIGASLQRVAVGLMGALAAGIPIGFALGLSRRAEEAAGPAFQFLRMVSPLSWMPVAVMLFGIGNARGDAVQNHAARRAERHSQRLAAGDWHFVGGAGALRNARRKRRLGLFYFGHARQAGVFGVDGGDCAHRHHRLAAGQRSAPAGETTAQGIAHPKGSLKTPSQFSGCLFAETTFEAA